jgi:ribulose-5-phosphate 4-epimerase/fuculose-1-phosphate aldolase
MTALTELKKTLAEAAVICEMEGLCDGFGHITVRVPGTDHILMTPQGPPGETTVDNIITLNLKGEKITGQAKRNNEYPIHTCIYRVRNDVQSIVHVHPPKTIAFSIAGQEIFPICSGDINFSPSVPIFGEPGTPTYIDSDELGDGMARVLGNGCAVLIRGHGIVTVGASIEAACLNAVNLEKLAGIQFMASMLLLSKTTKEDFQSPALLIPAAQKDGEDNIVRSQTRRWKFYLSKLKRYLNNKA